MRKLFAPVFSGPLLAISIVVLSVITVSVAFTTANAALNPIEIVSIAERSCTSVEILFSSSVPKKSLSYFVINAVVDSSVGQSKNIKKVIKTKVSGLITAEVKNLNPNAAYKFSVTAKTNKGKMISSEVVEYSSLCNLMELLSNLPADWGNPKPIPLPTAEPFAAPIVISVAAIAGVTAPVAGATPVNTTTAGTGYTGTVSWSGSPTTFAPTTTYTATITLTPTTAYTLTGLTANFFTVAGATSSTNPANSGVITAVFPATAIGPPVKVAITRASVGTARRTAFTTQSQVTIQDSASNSVTSSSAVVTATVSAGGTLVGTATATASSGVATFTGLGVEGIIATTYTITYTAVGLTVATATVTLTGTTCDGSTFTCQVGDTGPGGGKIFYVTSGTFTSIGSTCNTACKYLEAAPTSGTNAWSDFNSVSQWSGNTTEAIGVTAQGTAIGTGYANTLAIIGQSSTASMAGTISRAYGGPNSLSDWFLPSQDELIPLYSQRIVVGGFVSGFYWSSTESGASTALIKVFPGGGAGSLSKNSYIYLRPVRAF